MNAVFADTSALLALLDAKDRNHARAERAFATLRSRRASLVSTSFVLVETYALVGQRLGLDAVHDHWRSDPVLAAGNRDGYVGIDGHQCPVMSRDRGARRQ